MERSHPDSLRPVVRPAPARLLAPRFPRLTGCGLTREAVAPAVRPPEAPAPETRLAARFAAVLAEVLQGRRPPGHLAAVMDDDMLAVCDHLARSGLGRELRVRSVRAQAPAAGVVEGTLHLLDDRGRVSRAAAFRLDRANGPWRCRVLEIALTSDGVTRAGPAAP